MADQAIIETGVNGQGERRAARYMSSELGSIGRVLTVWANKLSDLALGDSSEPDTHTVLDAGYMTLATLAEKLDKLSETAEWLENRSAQFDNLSALTCETPAKEPDQAAVADEAGLKFGIQPRVLSDASPRAEQVQPAWEEGVEHEVLHGICVGLEHVASTLVCENPDPNEAGHLGALCSALRDSLRRQMSLLDD